MAYINLTAKGENELVEAMKRHGEREVAKVKAMTEKPNQRLFRIIHTASSYLDDELIMASSKADARRLARFSKIERIELVS